MTKEKASPRFQGQRRLLSKMYSTDSGCICFGGEVGLRGYFLTVREER
jgi:hypothetical protein